jgi:hypothetical protein
MDRTLSESPTALLSQMGVSIWLDDLLSRAPISRTRST